MSFELVSLIKTYGGAAGKALSLIELNYKQFYKSEKDANALYKAIYPSLRITCAKYGRDSDEFENLLMSIAKTAPFGVKKSNFIKKYITNKEGWRSLPNDPKLIPFGYWW